MATRAWAAPTPSANVDDATPVEAFRSPIVIVESAMPSPLAASLAPAAEEGVGGGPTCYVGDDDGEEEPVPYVLPQPAPTPMHTSAFVNKPTGRQPVGPSA